jgi:hypothetical protein
VPLHQFARWVAGLGAAGFKGFGLWIGGVRIWERGFVSFSYVLIFGTIRIEIILNRENVFLGIAWRISSLVKLAHNAAGL